MGWTAQLPAGRFVPWRFGRSSTLLEKYLWLMFAFLTGCVPPANAVTWIAVPRQRTRTAGGLVLAMLRISSTLANLTGRAVAGPMNALLAVRRAPDRVVDKLTEFR